MTTLDPRIHAFRADLADIRLQGQVSAARYVTGTPGVIISPIANVYARPDAAAPMTTQGVLGEPVEIFETQGGFYWVQLGADGYVGYVQATEIDVAKPQPLSHAVTAPLAHVYAQPDIKSKPIEILPMGAAFNAVGGAADEWLTLARGGFIKNAATRASGSKDRVEIAARFLNAPYLWGGATALGIDCSGLIQLAFHASGLKCPRDSDQQEAALGELIPPGEKLRRGDLIFFKGHVGIMADETNLLHASATWMRVIVEPLSDVEKIAAVTARRRML